MTRVQKNRAKKRTLEIPQRLRGSECRNRLQRTVSAPFSQPQFYGFIDLNNIRHDCHDGRDAAEIGEYLRARELHRLNLTLSL